MNKYYISLTRLVVVFVFYTLVNTFLFAQNSSYTCEKSWAHKSRMEQDPDYRKKTEQAELQIYEATKAYLREDRVKNDDEILTIPVVLHVIHETNDALGERSNISEEQLEQGMEWLNQAFRNVGPYAGNGVGANDPNNPERDKLKSVDTDIEFVLAKRDAFGRPTNGIVRYTNNDFSRLDKEADLSMKQWVAEQNGNSFPPRLYANIYLVRVICNSSGCGRVGGYAYLAGASGQFYDGIVAVAEDFGSEATTTSVMVHEFGHYLNLHHTFDNECIGSNCEGEPNSCRNQDCFLNGDFVCDTPPDGSDDSVDCDRAVNSCDSDTQSGFSKDQLDPIENYMDYTFRDCRNTFTQGQRTRMRLTLENQRAELLNSTGKYPLAGSEAGIWSLAAPTEVVNCANTLSPIIEIRNGGTDNIQHLTITAQIQEETSTTTWTGDLRQGERRNITLNAISLTNSGIQDLQIAITQVNETEGDTYEINNQANFPIELLVPVKEANICEAFVSTTQIPLLIEQPNSNGNIIDVSDVSACASKGEYALRINSWDEGLSRRMMGKITLPTYDMSIYQSPVLVFERSYRQSYSTSHTGLRVLASADCGTTFEEVYYKAGPALATRSGFTTSDKWLPTNCDEWASDTIDLANFGGADLVMLVFEVGAANVTNASSYQWGNNLYLDNICIKESDLVAACTLAIDSVQITQPSTCAAMDASISVYANENADMEYSLDGEIWQVSNTFENLNAASYTPQVRNSLVPLCNASAEMVRLDDPIRPTIDSVQTTDPSDCSEADGSIEIIANNETRALEYSIDGSAWQTRANFSALSAGTYMPSVRYVDEPACASSTNQLLNAPNGPLITMVETTNPATCNGIVGAIKITAVAIEGLNYEYSINGGATWQVSNTFTDLPEGTYMPRIRDLENTACVGKHPNVSLVGDTDANLTASIDVSTDSICANGFTRLLIGAGNGNSPYEVVYTDGTTEYTAVITFGTANVVVRPTGTTTYSLVRVTDISACSTQVSGSVQVVVQDCGNGLIIANDTYSSALQIGEFYPNPSTTAKVTLDYTSPQSEVLQLRIFDMRGAVQHAQTIQLEKGFNRLELDVADLPQGAYFVQLQTNQQQVVRKMLRR